MRALWILLFALGLSLAGLAWLLTTDAEPAASSSSAASAPRDTAPEMALPTELERVGDDTGAERSELAQGELASELRDAGAPRAVTRLCGRVVDAQGQPVEGVRVLCAAAGRGPSTPLDSAAWEEARREASSGADGRFCVEGAPAGVVRVALRSLDHAPLDIEGLLTERDVDNDVGDLEVSLGARLTGIVVDARGRPVEGAWLVRPWDTDRPGLGRKPGELGMVLGRSHASGEFDLRGVPVGPWTILVHAPEHPDLAAHGATSTPGEHRDDLVLRLQPAASIRGRVVVTPGPHAPELEQIEVRSFHTADESAARGEAAVSMRVASVQRDGRFHIEGLAAERSYRLSVNLREGAVARREVTLDAGASAKAGDENVEIRIGGVNSITFAPRDAVTGKVVEGLTTRLSARDANGKRRLLEAVARDTDGGRVQVLSDRRLSTGERAYLTLSTDEYHPFESEPFDVLPGAELNLGELALRPRPRLEFRVVSAQGGEPVSGARVWIKLEEAANGEQASTLRSELTGSDGLATVFGSEGACGQVLARHDRFASSTLSTACFRDAAQRLELVLTPGATLHVRVLQRDGGPAASRTVHAQRDPNVPIGPAETLRMLERTENTDGAGLAIFTGLTPGAYRVVLVEPRVGAPRTLTEHSSSTAFLVLAPDEERELELVALARGTLSGRVTSARRPLPNATVSLSPGSSSYPRAYTGRGEPLRVRTDSQGRYRIENLGVGGWNVSVTHGDFLTPTRLTLDHDGDARELDIDLPRNAVLGRIVDARGDAVSDAKVIVGRWQNVSNPRNRRERPFAPFLNGAPAAVTGADGTFLLQGLPADRLAIEVRHPRFQVLLTKPFVLVAGAEQSLGDLVLPSAGRVEVELERLPEGAPRPRAILRRLDGPRDESGGRETRALTLDSRGRASFAALAPGKWRAELDPRVQNQPRPRKDVVVRANETEQVRFESL
jgi:protocatechuate 3,4-dioxygenase beta subunit